ncbi:translation initiation factor IF-2-like [Aquila chrysaetos chrysaetos]|uniref:translation initiation factor IF-2-like n=1 Tax=Aquila chrysaetos chrysaetos TaxID=223781 RepID=UPI001176DA26|nr:translation initiation factor IF-2-like [Aquila chrysaetos chrysaetos]
MPGRRQAPLGRGGARPAGGALALRRAGRGGAGVRAPPRPLRRGPGGAGSGAEPPVRGAGGGRVRGSARYSRVPAEHCGKQVRAVKSRWYLWTVPTDVTNRSVLIAEMHWTTVLPCSVEHLLYHTPDVAVFHRQKEI